MPQKGLVSCIIIAMTANIVYNWLFSEGLFQLGQNIIFDMQQHSNDYLDYFFELFTLIVDPVIVVVAAVTLIITVRKKRIGFNALIFIILNCYLTTVLKAIYADPRPFWDHPSIYNLGYYCPKQYGNPSGNSWFSPIIVFVFMLPSFHSIILFISFALLVLVPMSRMYLGAHSLNQVVQGMFLGLCMSFLYLHGGLRHQINDFLSNVLTKRKWWCTVLLLHSLYLLAFFFNANFDIHSPQAQAKWAKQILIKCNRQVDSERLNLLMILFNSLLVNIATGIAVGYRQLISTVEGRSYLDGNWTLAIEYSRFVSIRYLSYGLVEIVLLLSGSFVSMIFFRWYGLTSLPFIFIANLGGLVSGYIYTSSSCHWLSRLGIIKQTVREHAQ